MIRENLSNFFNQWQLDKDNATEILGENRKYNADLKAGKLTDEVTDTLTAVAKDLSSKYKA